MTAHAPDLEDVVDNLNPGDDVTVIYINNLGGRFTLTGLVAATSVAALFVDKVCVRTSDGFCDPEVVSIVVNLPAQPHPLGVVLDGLEWAWQRMADGTWKCVADGTVAPWSVVCSNGPTRTIYQGVKA